MKYPPTDIPILNGKVTAEMPIRIGNVTTDPVTDNTPPTTLLTMDEEAGAGPSSRTSTGTSGTTRAGSGTTGSTRAGSGTGMTGSARTSTGTTGTGACS